MATKNNPFFLVIHTTYESVVAALYQGNDLLAEHTYASRQSSKMLIPAISALFAQVGRTLDECDFIACHAGPGPFTTLRVAIATANGLAFATQKPIVGVDGLYAFLQEHKADTPYECILLNAYANDVYYALRNNHSGTVLTGVAPIAELIPQLQQKEGRITFFGNGVDLHYDLLVTTLGDKAICIRGTSCASLASISALAYTQWQTNTALTTQLLPLYLKNSSSILAC